MEVSVVVRYLVEIVVDAASVWMELMICVYSGPSTGIVKVSNAVNKGVGRVMVETAVIVSVRASAVMVSNPRPTHASVLALFAFGTARGELVDVMVVMSISVVSTVVIAVETGGVVSTISVRVVVTPALVELTRTVELLMKVAGMKVVVLIVVVVLGLGVTVVVPTEQFWGKTVGD